MFGRFCEYLSLLDNYEYKLGVFSKLQEQAMAKMTLPFNIAAFKARRLPKAKWSNLFKCPVYKIHFLTGWLLFKLNRGFFLNCS